MILSVLVESAEFPACGSLFLLPRAAVLSQ